MQEKKTDRTNFLDRFNDLASRKSLSTSAACDLIGISRSMYYEIRDGKREPSTKMWDRLSDAELSDISSDSGRRVQEEIIPYRSPKKDPLSQMSDAEVLSFLELVVDKIETGELTNDHRKGARKLFESLKLRMQSKPESE